MTSSPRVLVLSLDEADSRTGQGQRSILLGRACAEVIGADSIDYLHTRSRVVEARTRFLHGYLQWLAGLRLSWVQSVPGPRGVAWRLAPHAAKLLTVRWLVDVWRARGLGPDDWVIQRYFNERRTLLMLVALRRQRINLLIDLDDNPVELALRALSRLRGLPWLAGLLHLCLTTLGINIRLCLFRLLLGRKMVLVSPSERNHGIAFRLWSGHVVPNMPFALPDAVPLLPADPVIGFIGTMNHAPNLRGLAWFAERVMPMIRQRCPDAELRFAGRSWHALPASERARVPALPWLVALGEPADVSTFYAQVALTICPVFSGAGTNIKVLESLAYGRPVVGTPKSVHGMAIEDPGGLVCSVASTPAEFADAVLACLAQISASPATVAEAARRGVAVRYTPAAVQARLAAAMSAV